MELVGTAKQMSAVFQALERVRVPLEAWLRDASDASDPTPIGVVKLGILFRASNQHGAIGNLLAGNHVEDALILTRALFELVLHTEELVRDGVDPNARALKYLQFCRLERFLEEREMRMLRLSLSGNWGSEDYDPAEQEQMAREEFSAFAFFDKKGKHRWFPNWCNKSVAVLAEQSSDRMRLAQYRVLYAMGSRMSHAGPAAVFPAIDLNGVPSDPARQQAAVQEGHLRLAASFGTMFLGEIFTMLSDRIPTFDAAWMSGVVVSSCRGILAGDA